MEETRIEHTLLLNMSIPPEVNRAMLQTCDTYILSQNILEYNDKMAKI